MDLKLWAVSTQMLAVVAMADLKFHRGADSNLVSVDVFILHGVIAL